MTQRQFSLLLGAALFLISGIAALVYQVIWQRILGIFSGMHIYSITMIVTAFMAGLGFGSLLGGRYADRLSRSRALLAFSACELLIGVFALVSPWLYYDLAYLKLGGLIRYPLVLPAIHLALLIVPTLLMGASLPLLSRGLIRGMPGAARVIGLLYGVNTLGAALGALLAVWFLIGSFGFVATIRLAACLNFAAAAGALWLGRRTRVDEAHDAQGPAVGAGGSQPAGPGTAPAGRPQPLWIWAALYGLSGFIALSLEILWFRILDVGIKSSPYTFGHLLGSFLFFLALGSLFGARVVARGRRPDLIFLWGQWAITATAATAVVVLCRYPKTWWPFAGLMRYWSSDTGIEISEIVQAWAGFAGGTLPETLVRAAQVYAFLPLFLLALPTFLMGLTYAYVQRTVQTDPHAIGWRVGLIQTANICGSILGSLLTGAVFLGVLGTAHTLRLLVVVAAVFAVAALRRGAVERTPARALAVGFVTVLLVVAIPGSDGFWARFHGSTVEDVLIAEDTSSVVALQRLGAGSAVVRVNGTGHSMLPYGGAHTILGTLPILLHPNPERILVIGLGAGNTAWAAAAAPDLERLDLYEIARPEFDVLQRIGAWFAYPPPAQLLADPRVRLTFSDGRLALRNTAATYDVIEIDALEPTMAYSGNLYSQEFFELAGGALRPGGILCSYTPTRRTRRTMVSAFPHVLHFSHAGNLHFMIGSGTPLGFDPDILLERLAEPALQQYYERSGMGPATSSQVRAFIDAVTVVTIGPANRGDYLDGDLNTDLFPRDEFDKTREAH